MKDHITLRILNRLNLLRYLDLTSKNEINNRIIKIPIIKGIGFDNLQLTELWLNPIIKEILQYKSGAFVDIGVNLGQTLLKVKSLDMNRLYYGFEPNPMCYYYTKELIKRNRFELCNIIPVGLYDRASLLKLLMNTDTDSLASLIEGFRDSSSYTSDIYVPVFEGDYLMNRLNINAISIIKVDVEGAELEVIKSLRSTIARYHPYILCEILPIYDENTSNGSFRKSRQNSLEKIINDENYILCRVHHRGDVMKIRSIETHSDLSLCDYLFIHESEEVNASKCFKIQG